MIVVSMLLIVGARTHASPLSEAIAADNLERVRALIADGADVNAPDPDRWHSTPLQIAARHAADGPSDHRMEIIGALLAAGADVNAHGEGGMTALQTALWAYPTAYSQDIAVALCAAGADPNAPDALGWTPVMEAARSSSAVVLMMLIEHGGDREAQTKDGWTLAMIAAASDDLYWRYTWLIEQENMRAADEGRAPRIRDLGQTAAMFAYAAEMQGPAAKVWALMRRGRDPFDPNAHAPDPDAKNATGQRIDEILGTRTDPEAESIRCALSIARKRDLEGTLPLTEDMFAQWPKPDGALDPRQRPAAQP